MSNFFDDLGKAMTRAVNSVSADFNVAAQEQRLKEAYQVLGRMHYEAVQAGKEVSGQEFDAQMAWSLTSLYDLKGKNSAPAP